MRKTPPEPISRYPQRPYSIPPIMPGTRPSPRQELSDIFTQSLKVDIVQAYMANKPYMDECGVGLMQFAQAYNVLEQLFTGDHLLREVCSVADKVREAQDKGVAIRRVLASYFTSRTPAKTI